MHTTPTFTTTLKVPCKVLEQVLDFTMLGKEKVSMKSHSQLFVSILLLEKSFLPSGAYVSLYIRDCSTLHAGLRNKGNQTTFILWISLSNTYNSENAM